GIAVLAARRAGRLLGVGGAIGTVPRTEVIEVALAGETPAERRRGLERVGRANGARPRASFRDVARPGDGAAGRPGVARGVLTIVARPVAQIGAARVAVVGAARPGRRLRIGRTVGAVRRAELVGIALASGTPAERRRGLERVSRANGARPRAGFRDVARPGDGATGRP